MPQVCAFEGLKRESIRAGRPNPRVGKWPPGADAGRPVHASNPIRCCFQWPKTRDGAHENMPRSMAYADTAFLVRECG
jgi:hypothetical protein